MAVLLENNAEGELAADIDAVQTTITLKAGQGALFPAPTGEDWTPVTLHDLQDNVEIVHCTGRSGDVLTVIRGAEGTTARPWLADDGAEIRYTRAVHEAFSSLAYQKMTISATAPTSPDTNDVWLDIS